MSEIPFPDMPRTHTFQRSVPEHELVLSFRDDDHAAKFHDWLEEIGWDQFTTWVEDGSPTPG